MVEFEAVSVITASNVSTAPSEKPSKAEITASEIEICLISLILLIVSEASSW